MSPTWNMSTVNKVRRLFVDIDISQMALNADAIETTRLNAAATLRNWAHAYGVDLHPDDVGVAERDPELDHFVSDIVPFRAAWRPTTTEVEIVQTGEHDGRIMNFGRVEDQLRLPVTRSWESAARYGDPSPVANRDHRVEIVEFQLAGWREVERRWIYSE